MFCSTDVKWRTRSRRGEKIGITILHTMNLVSLLNSSLTILLHVRVRKRENKANLFSQSAAEYHSKPPYPYDPYSHRLADTRRTVAFCFALLSFPISSSFLVKSVSWTRNYLYCLSDHPRPLDCVVALLSHFSSIPLSVDRIYRYYHMYNGSHTMISCASLPRSRYIYQSSCQ